MAGAAHLGVALAAKRAAPRVPLWALVLSSYAIDIVFVGFALAGKEHMPARSSKARPAAEIAGARDADEATTGAPSSGTNPWSHGLAMAAVWTLLSMVISAGVRRNRHTEYGSLAVGAALYLKTIRDKQRP
jgi:hypothetical protein